MSVFGSIMSKIFNAAESTAESVVHPSAQAGSATQASPSTPASATTPETPVPAAPSQPASPAQSASPAEPASPASGAAAQPVDVEAVLSNMASAKGGGGNWQTSIVDLLKLLDLDSSLNARKELAGELNVHVGADGTAEENIALHKAVMQKLADNGGKVPENMKG